MGMDNRISSVRPVDGNRQLRQRGAGAARRAELRVPPPPDERAVRGAGHLGARRHGPARAALLGRAPAGRANGATCNVPGAVIGGVLGGILGHQVGGGTRQRPSRRSAARSAARALGANVDRIRDPQSGQRRAPLRERRRPGTPQYWDVTYNFRGVAAPRADDRATRARRSPSTADGEPRRLIGRDRRQVIDGRRARAPSVRACRRSGRRSRSAAPARPASRRPAAPGSGSKRSR